MFRAKLSERDTQRIKSYRLTLLLQRRYFSRLTSKRTVFENGSKSAGGGSGSIRGRDWLRHLQQGHQVINPVSVARRFQAKYEEPGYGSYSWVAEYFGVSRPKVCYYLAIVHRLPEAFVAWLEAVDDPEVLRRFAEKRLRPITRVVDEGEQWGRIRELADKPVGVQVYPSSRSGSGIRTI